MPLFQVLVMTLMRRKDRREREEREERTQAHCCQTEETWCLKQTLKKEGRDP